MYIYPAVPPVADAVAEPVAFPIQETSTLESIAANKAAWGWPIVTSQVVLYPNLSVTVAVWEPAFKATACAVVSPLSHK